MSVRSARLFLPELRAVERDLTLPVPARVRILRELEFDLEELRARLLDRGVPPEEASRRALEAILPDGGALRDLEWLHAPFYGRVTRGVPSRRLRLAERTTLAAAGAVVLVAEAVTLLRTDLLRDPSPFLWPVLVCGAVLFAMTLARAFQLWIKKDHSNSGRGLGGMLGLSAGILGLGVVGVLAELYGLAATLERSPELVGVLGPAWLERAGTLLAAALLLALAGGVAWLVMGQWLALISSARRDALGLGVEVPPATKEGT